MGPHQDNPQEAQNDNQHDMEIILSLEALDPSYPFSSLMLSQGVLVGDDFEWPTPDAMRKYQAPPTWGSRKKVFTLSGLFLSSILASYSAGAYTMTSGPLREKWNINDTEYNVGITIFVLAFGFAPMIMAPVSEQYGRYGVFVGAGFIFFLGTLGCALTDSYSGMLIARLVVGTGASIFATLTAGVVSDLYHTEQRNIPMTLYTMTVLAGTGLGPLVSGIVVDHLSWRWVYYLQFISIGIATLCICIFFTETRSNVLLRRKCHALNELLDMQAEKVQRRPKFHSEAKIELSLGVDILWKSFAFPLRLLLTEPVVVCFSAWVSFSWGILYLQFGSVQMAFEDVYGFSDSETGGVYAAVMVGAIIGAIISIAQEPVSRNLFPQRMKQPEGRLLPACLISVLLPAGLFWFGWTTSPGISWISPCLAVAACTMGIFSIYIATFNYLADTYHRYASSALAAQSMCRNLLAGIFPLFTRTMFQSLGYGKAGSILGVIAIFLTGVPWVLSIFGSRIRSRSPFASELLK